MLRSPCTTQFRSPIGLLLSIWPPSMILNTHSRSTRPSDIPSLWRRMKAVRCLLKILGRFVEYVLQYFVTYGSASRYAFSHMLALFICLQLEFNGGPRRACMKHMPLWLWRRIGSKILAARCQASFLLEVEDNARLKPLYQPSLHKTRAILREQADRKRFTAAENHLVAV